MNQEPSHGFPFSDANGWNCVSRLTSKKRCGQPKKNVATGETRRAKRTICWLRRWLLSLLMGAGLSLSNGQKTLNMASDYLTNVRPVQQFAAVYLRGPERNAGLSLKRVVSEKLVNCSLKYQCLTPLGLT